MNRIVLIGRLARDPELSVTSNNISVCRITLAVRRRYKAAEGEDVTDFFNCVLWRGQAENAHKYLKKGDRCAVIGSLYTNDYEDKNGNKRRIYEVNVDEIEFLSSKNASSDERELTPEEKRERAREKLLKSGQTAEQLGLAPTQDDDLPF